jgi:hypothetical protein
MISPRVISGKNNNKRLLLCLHFHLFISLSNKLLFNNFSLTNKSGGYHQFKKTNHSRCNQQRGTTPLQIKNFEGRV